MIRAIAPCVIAFGVLTTFHAASPARAEELTAEQVKALAEKPDDRTRVPAALKFFPSATEYDVTISVREPGQQQAAGGDKIKAREKLVDGKYLVSTFRPGGFESDLIMVIFHDAGEDCYKKFLLVPDAPLSRAIGTRVGDSRSISWVLIDGKGEEQTLILSHEVHTDKGSRWKEVQIRGGAILGTSEGTAVVTKKPG